MYFYATSLCIMLCDGWVFEMLTNGMMFYLLLCGELELEMEKNRPAELIIH